MTIPEIEKQIEETKAIVREIGEFMNRIEANLVELRGQLGIEKMPEVRKT